MGVNTNALLTKAPTIIELMQWANENYKAVSVTPSSVEYMYYLNFTDGKDVRNLAVLPHIFLWVIGATQNLSHVRWWLTLVVGSDLMIVRTNGNAWIKINRGDF